MVGKIVLLVLILVSLAIESTLVPFPLVLIFSLFYLLFFDDIWAICIVLLVSIFLDIFSLQLIGTTALFVFGVTLVLIAMEKLFSLQGPVPFALAVLCSVFLYSFIASYPFSLVLTTILGVGLIIFVFIQRNKQKKGGVLA